MSPQRSKPRPSFCSVSQQAYNEIVSALSKDMPLIMHGSGDVAPWEIHPQSQQILSQLTANYISNLVAAATDAHEILNGGRRPPLPPPPPPSTSIHHQTNTKYNRSPPLPAPYIWPETLSFGSTTTFKTATGSNNNNNNSSSKTKHPSLLANKESFPHPGDPANMKRRKRHVDYWDEPLPEPKIKKKNNHATSHKNTKTTTTTAAVAVVEPLSEKDETDEKEKQRTITDWKKSSSQMQQQPQNNASLVVAAASLQKKTDPKGVSIDDWVGVAGVDFFEESRSRTAHIRQPIAMGVQCFIFPICHDGGLYGKIVDIQGQRRTIEPWLHNNTIRDVIRNEGALQNAGALRKRKRDGNKTKNSKKKKDKSIKPPRTKDNNKGDDAPREDAEDEDADEDDDEDVDDDDDEPEATDSEDEGTGATWPGLDGLLPVHTTKDFLQSMM